MNTTSTNITTEGGTIINDGEWKLHFIGEKSRENYLNLIIKVRELISQCQQQSEDRVSNLSELKRILTIIRDRVIGNNCCKYFFMKNDLLQSLLPLLWMKDETNAEFTAIITECQKDALTLFSVLISQNGLVQWSNLPANEVFSNLLVLLQGTTNQNASQYFKFFEILTKSLVCFAKKVESTRDAAFLDNNLPILLKLLDPKNSNQQISQNVAILLSTSCDTPLKQRALINLKTIDLLLETLNNICYIDDLGRLTISDPRLLDGTIDLLCTLTRENVEVCSIISSASLRSRNISSLFYQLLSLCSLSTDLKLKLSLLNIHLYKADQSKTLSFEAQNSLLGFIISLMNTTDDYSSRAAYLLAFLVSDDCALQAAAIQMNAISILLKMLEKAKAMDSVFYENRLDCALIVASSLSSTSEENRKYIVESKLLGLIIESMTSSNVNLRISACQCARNLSRSVKNLRTNLFDAGISKPLLKLLHDESLSVQITACATICNMVLDFTPIKKVIVNEGAVPDLVALVSHPDSALRVNAIWSLKNLLYHSDNEIRGKVLSCLSFEIINRLLEENNEAIQEQTLNLIRNIGCGKQENIEEVFNGFGCSSFINMLEFKIQMTNPQIILQTLYIIVNVATGNELHKSRIMESSILLQCVLNYLGHENPKIRLASIWSLINLTWPNEPGFVERATFLVQMGALKVLKSLQNDPDYDVRQKVNCAIANFASVHMPPRRSKRTSKSANDISKHSELEAIELETNENDPISIQAPSEYFEFHDTDLKNTNSERKEMSSEPESIPSPSRSGSKAKSSSSQLLSRKIKLLIRKVHIMCELASSQFFIKKYVKNQELMALILSGLPPHILRILDPVLIEEGKTLKNSMAMLATWWKNNIGLRIISSDSKTIIRLNSKSKLLELKSAFFKKSAYEDDYVWLFALICHGLGINVRIVHSLNLIPASNSQNSKENNSKFQYFPRYWIEFYSKLDERWISVDCIQGLVDERNRLENNMKPHSFVLSIDIYGIFCDLTEKYSSDYLERSFRLRKDEDKWLKDILTKLNSMNKSFKKNLPDRDQVKTEKDSSAPIEIPKTLAGIKNHPTLMLESQLRKYEVFYPVTEPVGYFKGESVFLRENLQKVRSKDAWLSQCARIVKEGEEPIKLVNLPRKAGAPEGEPTGIQPLYGEWQTDPYSPPEVIDGKVPRNDHGNVDLFQPSMLPKDCVHVTLPGAWKVARHLGIDYADACIGFSFHGGRALPSIHGIVITNANFKIFESEYKNKLIESFKNDAHELEKQIAQKWVKIIKNALIARRLKNDSSMSLSESLISSNDARTETTHTGGHETLPEQTISAFTSSNTNISHESEIEEFDAI